MNIIQPTILRQDVIVSLNRSAYSSCGCFFFLEAKPLVHYPLASDYQNAFVLNIIRLYVLYKDCGRKFLPLCLSAALQPPDQSDYAEMDNRRSQAEGHYKRIQSFMRAYYCHGNFQAIDPQDMGALIDNYTITKMGSWLANTHQYSQDKWENCYNRLLHDAENLYSYLLDWTYRWSKQPEARKKELIRRFVYYSISGVDTQKNPTPQPNQQAQLTKQPKSALEASLDMKFLSDSICKLRSVSYESAKSIYNDHIGELVTAIRNAIIRHESVHDFYEMIINQVISTFAPPEQSSISIFEEAGLNIKT
jgi:hypothetical protein